MTASLESILRGRMFTRLQQICPILFSSIFETEHDGIDGTSSTGAARQTPFYVCVTEHTRNIDGTAADGNLVKAGDWRCLAWQLERAYPSDFARPEVALSLIAQNNTVENHLTINITGAQAKAIELEAEPVRQKVAEMIARYRAGSVGQWRRRGS
jgi:hypothetical protein